MGRGRVVAGQADRVDGAEGAGRDEPPGLAVRGVEAALEADLERDAGGLDVLHHPAGLVQLQGDRLLAEDRQPAVGAGPDEGGVGVGGGRDDHRLGPVQRRVDRLHGAGADGRGDGRRPGRVDVGDEQLRDAGVGLQEPGVEGADPAGAQERDAHQRLRVASW